jgi:hypothetical protein
LFQWAEDFAKFAPIFIRGLLIAALAAGLLACINPFASVWLLPQKDAFAQRKVVIERIPSGASVLVSCDLYFEVDRSNKAAMAHHEHMDLNAFEYILSSKSPIPTAKDKDQWFDTLTPEQSLTLSEKFTQVAEVVSHKLPFHVPLTSMQPSTTACYLWRRTEVNDRNNHASP